MIAWAVTGGAADEMDARRRRNGRLKLGRRYSGNIGPSSVAGDAAGRPEVVKSPNIASERGGGCGGWRQVIKDEIGNNYW